MACSPQGEAEDNFTKLYNILIRLIYENKRLSREEYENEQEILRKLKEIEGAERTRNQCTKQYEGSLMQMQDLKTKNSLIAK